MFEFALSLEQQEKITIQDLAQLIFQVLKQNLSIPGRDVSYNPGNLMSIKEFEICIDKETRKQQKHREFDKKYAQAVQLLKDKRLIMKDHTQGSDEFVELTENGEKTEPDRFVPGIAESDSIIQGLQASIPNLDEIVILYFKEAWDTFQHDYLISSAFCLGGMSERIILILSEKTNNVLNTPQILQQYSDCRSIKAHWNFVKNNLPALKRNYPGNEDLWYDLDSRIEFLFTNFRLTRNEAGHPDCIPDINGTDHDLRLRTVPKYLEAIYKVINLL